MGAGTAKRLSPFPGSGNTVCDSFGEVTQPFRTRLPGQAKWIRTYTPAHACGLLFLLAQLAAFGLARVSDARYFCWSPYDRHTTYTIEVELEGRALSATEVEARYRLSARGGNPRSPYEILGAIERYERSYGARDSASVRVEYRVNGRAQPPWLYPPAHASVQP